MVIKYKPRSFTSNKEIDRILFKLDKGIRSGFIRMAIKEKFERDGFDKHNTQNSKIE